MKAEAPIRFKKLETAYVFLKIAFQRARELYEKALAIAKDKEDIAAVKERLEDLPEGI
ncbi:hypothetical protein [Neobacillus sp. YIM B06451]|uniref:hypothetical protein n=1 Tax=Neobacillus sp. YIM B06451 TaxID=3070994 RepID=UPI00292ECC39|nr:hypothetical protein [Neobacillus sp. YIM B06451]